MSFMLIIQFLFLTAVITGVIIFFLHRFLVSSTEGAVQRLNAETESVRKKQSELDQKIKEANEELERRKKEAEELTKKMRTEAEEGARAERDKMMKKARDDSEEIITRAQMTKDQIRAEIVKEMEIKTIDFAMKVLNSVLSDKAKGLLDKQLIEEFLENLTKMDINQVSVETDTADVITVSEVDNAIGDKVKKILKDKLKRDIKIKLSTDPALGGGVLLKFGSLAVDGSLQSILADKAIGLKQVTERG